MGDEGDAGDAGDAGVEDWRAALLSDEAGIPVVAVRDGRVRRANRPARMMFEEVEPGTRVEELFDEGCRDRLRAALASSAPATAVQLDVARRAGPPVASAFLVLSARGEHLLLWRSMGAGYTEELAHKLMAANTHLTNVTRELAQARDSERRLRGELEELSRASSAVAEALADTLTELPQVDVSAVLMMIAVQARELTRADYVAIGIGTDPEEPFAPWIFLGMSRETEQAIGRHPRPVGSLGRVAREGAVLRSADLPRDPAFRGLPPHHPPLGSFLGVPLRHRGRPVGNLYLANRPGGAVLSEQDERLVRTLASKVGFAIETARLHVASSLQRVWLQNVIDQLPDGILLYDEHGKRKAMNRLISELACDAPERTDSFGNAAVIDLRDAEGAPLPREREPLVRVLVKREASFRDELFVRRRGRELIPVVVSAGPVLDAHGGLSGAMLMVRDISSRKALERLREEWAAVIAHDLRQPVNTIGLASEVLLGSPAGELSATSRRAVERIASSARRLNLMVNDLLDTSRIESRHLTIECRPIALRGFIESTVSDLGDLIAGHEVRVIASDDDVVWIDPDRIHQVLGNLLSNAVKYGARGTEIRIESIPYPERVEVVVTNHGPGIPAEQLAALFSRFARAGGAQQRGVPGLGLGLYIARGLVEAHGGRLWGESTPDATTSFHFTLRRWPEGLAPPPAG